MLIQSELGEFYISNNYGYRTRSTDLEIRKQAMYNDEIEYIESWLAADPENLRKFQRINYIVA